MFSRRREQVPDEPRRRRDRRRGSARVAWVLLIGAGALVLTRALWATVIQVHGDGMAPTILDGESVLMIRGRWGIESGDLVVYDPSPTPKPAGEPPAEAQPHALPFGPSPGEHWADPRATPRGALRGTAVVDVDEVESNGRRVRDGGAQASPRSFRVGRVLAVPGDRVTFHVAEAGAGLAVNGQLLRHKLDTPVRLELAGRPAPGEDGAGLASLRPLAWETLGEARYPVLLGAEAPQWPGMGLPDDPGPIEVEAEGYLILADNRDEGACCDSRALGWIAPQALRGEIVLRLAGDPGAAPDSDPRSRGLQWLP